MLELRDAIFNKRKAALHKQEVIFMAGNFEVDENFWLVGNDSQSQVAAANAV